MEHFIHYPTETLTKLDVTFWDYMLHITSYTEILWPKSEALSRQDMSTNTYSKKYKSQFSESLVKKMALLLELKVK